MCGYINFRHVYRGENYLKLPVSCELGGKQIKPQSD